MVQQGDGDDHGNSDHFQKINKDHTQRLDPIDDEGFTTEHRSDGSDHQSQNHAEKNLSVFREILYFHDESSPSRIRRGNAIHNPGRTGA